MTHATLGNALQALGPGFELDVIKEERPDQAYLFTTFLPEEEKLEYTAEGGAMRVVGTMAGIVGMDSPYPPGGLFEISKFLERTAKIANRVDMPEEILRQLQRLSQVDAYQQVTGAAPTGLRQMIEELLNFTLKAIIQPHYDTMEYLRGLALFAGEIDWLFNKTNLKVDYGIPAANKLALRQGNDAYGGTASKFWADDRAAQRLLRYRVQARVMHVETFDVIINNAANNIEIVSMQTLPSGVRMASLRKYVSRAGGVVASSDARDSFDVYIYDREGEMLNPADTSQTIKVPFAPLGKISYLGAVGDSQYRFGQGATPDADVRKRVGHTHIGPTTENDGLPGRFVEVFKPEQEKWMITGRGVTNGLPVIEAPKKIVIASTEMPS